MNDLEKRGRGRPKTGEAMNHRFLMRMDDDLHTRVGNLCNRTGLTKTDIFRQAFDMFEKEQLKTITDLLKSKSSGVFEDYYDDYFGDFDDNEDSDE